MGDQTKAQGSADRAEELRRLRDRDVVFLLKQAYADWVSKGGSRQAVDDLDAEWDRRCAERDAEKARADEAETEVRRYREMLALPDALLLQHFDGGVTAEVAPTKVGELVDRAEAAEAEGAKLRERVAELEAELSGISEEAQ